MDRPEGGFGGKKRKDSDYFPDISGAKPDAAAAAAASFDRKRAESARSRASAGITGRVGVTVDGVGRRWVTCAGAGARARPVSDKRTRQGEGVSYCARSDGAFRIGSVRGFRG